MLAAASGLTQAVPWGPEMAPEAVEHAYGKCIEALDRIPRATRLALLQWSLAPALRDIVRIRICVVSRGEGEAGLLGLRAGAPARLARLPVCRGARSYRLDGPTTKPRDGAAVALLHYDVSTRSSIHRGP